MWGEYVLPSFNRSTHVSNIKKRERDSEIDYNMLAYWAWYHHQFCTKKTKKKKEKRKEFNQFMKWSAIGKLTIKFDLIWFQVRKEMAHQRRWNIVCKNHITLYL